MTAGPVNRALLESNFQNPGDVYSDLKTEGAFDVVADQVDDNWNYVAGLVNSGTLVPYPAFMNRQAIINGNFSVNQRGVSGSVVLSPGQYGHDRWKAGSGGCTYTFSTLNNETTITISSGTLLQVIEGVNLSTGTYSLVWSGTAQGKIGSGSFGSTGITGDMVGGTNAAIEFNAGTLSKVSYNFGSTPLPFQLRGYSEELALCRRYFQKFTESSGVSQIQVRAVFITTNELYFTTINFEEMRIPPTATLSNLAVISTSIVVQTGFTFSATSLSTKGIRILATKNAHGLTDGVVTFAASMNGFIFLDAEL